VFIMRSLVAVGTAIMDAHTDIVTEIIGHVMSGSLFFVSL
jgi:hypothetical protein